MGKQNKATGKRAQPARCELCGRASLNRLRERNMLVICINCANGVTDLTRVKPPTETVGLRGRLEEVNKQCG